MRPKQTTETRVATGAGCTSTTPSDGELIGEEVDPNLLTKSNTKFPLRRQLMTHACA